MKSAVKQPDIIDPKTGKPMVIEDDAASVASSQDAPRGKLRDRKGEVGSSLATPLTWSSFDAAVMISFFELFFQVYRQDERGQEASEGSERVEICQT